MRHVAVLLVGLATALLPGLATDTCRAQAPVARRQYDGSSLYQYDGQQHHGAYVYGPHDGPDHYPRYGYGFSTPEYHWGWFGAHHRPMRVRYDDYYGKQWSWSIRRGM